VLGTQLRGGVCVGAWFRLLVQRVGKKRSLGFVLQPWMDSGLIRLGVWLGGPSLM